MKNVWFYEYAEPIGTLAIAAEDGAVTHVLRKNGKSGNRKPFASWGWRTTAIRS